MIRLGMVLWKRYSRLRSLLCIVQGIAKKLIIELLFWSYVVYGWPQLSSFRVRKRMYHLEPSSSFSISNYSMNSPVMPCNPDLEAYLLYAKP